MKKCSRLICEEIEKEINERTEQRNTFDIKDSLYAIIDHYIGEAEDIRKATDLEPGDIMTGFELVASFPMEEQLNMTWQFDDIFTDLPGDSIRLDCAYIYKGDRWEVVK